LQDRSPERQALCDQQEKPEVQTTSRIKTVLNVAGGPEHGAPQNSKHKTRNFIWHVLLVWICPRNKRGVIGLTYIYGIGVDASAILTKAGIDENTKVEQWTDDNIKTISRIIAEEYKTEGQLRSEVQLSIKRLMDIGCYRGLRHRKGFRCVASAPVPMRVPVKASVKRWQTRKKQRNNTSGAGILFPTPFGASAMPLHTATLTHYSLDCDKMAKGAAKKVVKRKVKITPEGIVFIQASFNNIIISITNKQGEVVSWASAGKAGFRGSKKNTPYAAQVAANDAAKTAFEAGMRSVEVFVKGPGLRSRSRYPCD
jgi:small subunit ribosomal protein S11